MSQEKKSAIPATPLAETTDAAKTLPGRPVKAIDVLQAIRIFLRTVTSVQKDHPQLRGVPLEMFEDERGVIIRTEEKGEPKDVRVPWANIKTVEYP